MHSLQYLLSDNQASVDLSEQRYLPTITNASLRRHDNEVPLQRPRSIEVRTRAAAMTTVIRPGQRVIQGRVKVPMSGLTCGFGQHWPR